MATANGSKHKSHDQNPFSLCQHMQKYINSDPPYTAVHFEPQIEDPILKDSIQKLREVLGPLVLPQHTDYSLARFLKARNNNVDDTVLMYKEMLSYRTKYKVDDPDFLKSFKPNQAFLNHYPHGVMGHDRDGHPIVYDFPGRIDVKGFANAMSDEEFAEQVFWNLEVVLRMMDCMSCERNKLIDRWTVVVDVRDLSWEHFSKFQLARGMKIQQLFDVNYPERVHKLLVVNISRYFDIGYQLFKPFIPEATREKIVILKHQKDLLNYIEADQLPAAYGGTRVDSTGDPECKEWISYGSKVPPDLYKANLLHNLSTQWSVCHIKAGKHFKVPIDAQQGDNITYMFYSEAHDIAFGISFSEKDWCGDLEWIRKLAREKHHQGVIQGSFRANKTGSYVLTFDNSYSRLNSKTIHYDYTIEES